MTTGEKLDSILALARADGELKSRLLALRDSAEPMENFCKEVSLLGFDLTPGELITAGEEYSCNQLKSTNGGGVNPYDYYDDLFDHFFIALIFS